MREMIVCFSVPFVKGKARPRVTAHGAYTPQKTEVAEIEVWKAFVTACKERYGELLEAPKNVPVHVIIKAYEVMPKNTPGKRGDTEPFVQKPDVDNIAKLVLDALNPMSKQIGKKLLRRRGAWVDDSQVVRVICSKIERRRGGSAHTDVIVIWTDEDDKGEQND